VTLSHESHGSERLGGFDLAREKQAEPAISAESDEQFALRLGQLRLTHHRPPVFPRSASSVASDESRRGPLGLRDALNQLASLALGGCEG
jgi:hypothetical protein